MKKWLAAQPVQPATIADLQQLIDHFVEVYNHQRPHCSLPQRATPATSYNGRPQGHPDSRPRPRRALPSPADIVDKDGKLSLGLNGRMHHIGVGRPHARTHVIKLVDDLNIRIINATTGELIRELTLDPSRNYPPLDRPPK
jgi:hypothetical protein